MRQAEDIQVVGEAGSAPELSSYLAQNPPPDVLLLDITMPDSEVCQAVSQLRAQYPGIKILIVTVHDDRSYVRNLVEAGVDGYLLKDEEMPVYVRAVRNVAYGGTYFSQRAASIALTNNGELFILSRREVEVLELAATGATSKAIAAQLAISPKTVDSYVERACRKLDADNRTAAAVKAMQLGLLSDKE